MDKVVDIGKFPDILELFLDSERLIVLSILVLMSVILILISKNRIRGKVHVKQLLLICIGLVIVAVVLNKTNWLAPFFDGSQQAPHIIKAEKGR
jgi:C4-dicarboxylate transporter